MSDPTFLGLTPAWVIAIATGFYAAATGGLAWVTRNVALRAAKGSEAATAKQIEAAAANVARQIEATEAAALIQARATAVSNNRQGWINELRSEVTAFLTEMDIKFVVDDDLRLSDRREEEQLRIARALRSHIFKVRLLLNPNEGESTTLIEMMDDIVEKDVLTGDDREALVSHTQGILKAEWERVKSGK